MVDKFGNKNEFYSFSGAKCSCIEWLPAVVKNIHSPSLALFQSHII